MTASMRRTKLVAILLAAACAAPAVSLAANLPEPVRKLSGSSDDAARAVLEKHAYFQRSEKSSWGRKLTFWWNDAARQCAQVTTLFGKVLQVELVPDPDCRVAAGSAGSGALIEPTELMGLPRNAAEARLTRAGFNVINTDMSKGEIIYIWWFNGRQCLAANIVADRYDLIKSLPLNQCK